jgi:hypothetical protein
MGGRHPALGKWMMMKTAAELRVHAARAAVALAAIAGLLAPPAPASTLKPETVAAFDQYVKLAEQRMDAELQNGHFLFLDGMPDERRGAEYDAVKRGEIFVTQLHTPSKEDDDGKLKVPGGLMHHWVAVMFIPRKSVKDVEAVLQDYRDETKIYKPDIQQARVISHTGDDFKIFLRMYTKSVVTVVLNGNFDIHNDELGPTRAASRSHSTRIAEVVNFGRPDEHELPVGNDHGYMWRMNSYWRIEQKDGGVYVQIESIELSRTIPTELRIFFGSIIENFPRKTMARLLTQTRGAVISGIANPR